MHNITIFRKYLTQGELLQVVKADLSTTPALANCRDFFMTQCLTGKSFSSMRKEAIKRDDSDFAHMTGPEYVERLQRIIDIAHIKQDETSVRSMNGSAGFHSVKLIVTSDLGRNTYFNKLLTEDQIALFARTREKLTKQYGTVRFDARNYITQDELRKIEALDLMGNPELYACRDVLLASCRTANSVSTMMKNDRHGSFSEPEYTMFGDSDIYADTLAELLQAAGIKIIDIVKEFDEDDRHNYVRVLEVSADLGRNTYMTSAIEPVEK